MKSKRSRTKQDKTAKISDICWIETLSAEAMRNDKGGKGFEHTMKKVFHRVMAHDGPE